MPWKKSRVLKTFFVVAIIVIFFYIYSRERAEISPPLTNIPAPLHENRVLRDPTPPKSPIPVAIPEADCLAELARAKAKIAKLKCIVYAHWGEYELQPNADSEESHTFYINLELDPEDFSPARRFTGKTEVEVSLEYYDDHTQDKIEFHRSRLPIYFDNHAGVAPKFTLGIDDTRIRKFLDAYFRAQTKLRTFVLKRSFDSRKEYCFHPSDPQQWQRGNYYWTGSEITTRIRRGGSSTYLEVNAFTGVNPRTECAEILD